MAFVRVEQRNAHLASSVKLEFVNGREGRGPLETAHPGWFESDRLAGIDLKRWQVSPGIRT